MRKQLSRIKGGGLARACRAGRLDLAGDLRRAGRSAGPDRLGPDGRRRSLDAAAGARRCSSATAHGGRHLRRACSTLLTTRRSTSPAPFRCHGHQPRDRQQRAWRSTAAAAKAARARLRDRRATSATSLRRPGRGRRPSAWPMRPSRCVERPRPQLPGQRRRADGQAGRQPSERGLGGRNQQLVLAAVVELERAHGRTRAAVVILSGGTDGEDGPTDAAGALADEASDRRGATA